MDRNDIAGLRAIVTGASSGIGAAIADALIGAGVRVLLTARSEDKLSAIAQKSANAEYIACDIGKDGSADLIVSACVQAFGGIDIIVNNAGYAFKAEVRDLTADVFDECYRVNVRAPFLLCRAAYPYLCASPAASVINIGSVVGHKGYETQCAYGCSKHALEGFTKVLAREWFADGIRVHLISPGSVDAGLGHIMRPDLSPDMMSKSQDIADVALFLLSHRGNTVIDEVQTHRYTTKPWA